MYSGGNRCCLLYCTSISSSKIEGTKFHRFPKDLARCDVWIEKCGPINLPSIEPIVLYKNYRICSLHFEDKMYINAEKSRLSINAIPTLFKGYSVVQPPPAWIV